MPNAMTKPQVAVIVGSTRPEWINRKLARALAALGVDRFDARFVRIDDLPLYNQDQELPLPTAVARFKNELAAADGMLIVTPEHNRSIPAVLKNAIDWGTRPYGRNVWSGKPGFITGTSPGAIGTALVQQHLRSVMGGLGMILLGGEAYITFKPNLIDDQGNIGDEGTRKFLQDFVDRFATLAGATVLGRARRGIGGAEMTVVQRVLTHCQTLSGRHKPANFMTKAHPDQRSDR